MSDNRKNSFFDHAFQIGTPECAVFCAVVAMILGLLYLWVGFWNTALIFCLMAVGAFIGGVRDKKQLLKDLINTLFPPKGSVAYREPRHGGGRTGRRPSQENPEEEKGD